MTNSINNSCGIFSTLPLDLTTTIVRLLSLRKILELKECSTGFKLFIEAQRIVEKILELDYALKAPLEQFQLIDFYFSIKHLRKDIVADNLINYKKTIPLPIQWNINKRGILYITLNKQQKLSITMNGKDIQLSYEKKLKEISDYKLRYEYASDLNMATIDCENHVDYFKLFYEDATTPIDAKIIASIEMPKESIVIQENGETLFAIQFNSPKAVVTTLLNSLISPTPKSYGYNYDVFSTIFSDYANSNSFLDLVSFLKELYPIDQYPGLYEKNKNVFETITTEDENFLFCSLLLESFDSYPVGLSDPSSFQSNRDESFCQALLEKLFSKSYREFKDSESSEYIIQEVYSSAFFDCQILSRCPFFLKKILNDEMEDLLKDKIENSYLEYGFDALLLKEKFFADIKPKIELKGKLFPLRRQAINNALMHFKT